MCLLNGFYQLKCNFDVQGTQSVLVFMAVQVAVCFLFNSTLPFLLDCITIDSVIIINISTVLNLRQENFSMKSKCKCGDVFGFKIIEALRLIGEPEREQALRRFVTSTKRGCAGRLTFPGNGQVSGCIHIQRRQLPESILKSMDKGTIIDLYTYNAQSITSKKMQY